MSNPENYEREERGTVGDRGRAKQKQRDRNESKIDFHNFNGHIKAAPFGLLIRRQGRMD